ncbi:bifunctional phosphoribosylaminoimidazolecarboxamide formyltransferase/IMP cyclohydrolase [Candidatus Peregrinibacteria bacterium]|nr:bifunctional phosphoribosylaminoimidazolecarboxamide formyltransferase/IMP cyclohydrolase [Candidatus Peregrinibacteria bacterium]
MSSKKYALISVYDKTGIREFASELSKKGYEIISTGGTSEFLKKAGLKITDIADITGFPEILNGRVKTLHPKIHGGILAMREDKDHEAQLGEHGINPIDIVVCNLYPFEEAVEAEAATEDEIIENIDIGGVTLIRAAAKNYKYVTVITQPEDYNAVLEEIKQNNATSLETRRKLARKGFSRTYQYDEAIEKWFRKILGEPELLDLHYEKVVSLRYGENPHQSSAFFKNPLNRDSNVVNAKVLQGKQMSFNNYVDADSALELVKEFERPTAAIIKHNNPCGVASADTIEEAFDFAYQADTISAFGGVVALNRPCTKEIAEYIIKNKIFFEIIICPKFENSSLELLKKKENLRLLETGPLKIDMLRRDIKKVAGGILIQTKDTYQITEKDLKVVTRARPTDEQIRAMIFATKVVKHVMSNAVVFAKFVPSKTGGAAVEVTTGIGSGQTSRVDSVVIAAHKAKDRHDENYIKDSVMSSDAFFPFPDAAIEAVKAGASAIVQPGGSIRDEEVIKEVDKLGVAMVFTGKRFFRH